MVAPQAIARGDGDPLLGLEAGARFGVLGLRATGAHAAVYDAWDAAKADACVLKIVRCERHALGDAHDLFRREASLMRGVPSSAQVRAVGSAAAAGPGFAFLAMDLAAGLRITEASAPLDVRGRAICEAVAGLHQAGVSHGDLKPAHLLYERGKLTLLDFGSAAFEGRAADATPAMTPAYAAPEREATGPSSAADVYAVGCVLYELATGKRPFAAFSGSGLARAHANDAVSCAEMPLAKAVTAALEKRPERRPSATALLDLIG